MSWKPLTVEQLRDFLRTEVELLKAPQQVAFDGISIEPCLVKTTDGPGVDGLSMWLVGLRGNTALYWDSIEEEFGIGELRDGRLSHHGTYGDRLAWSLERLLSSDTSGASV